ncbi:MAG: hypothetical protein AAGK66_07125 [Pseudomonadota bacterium]
MKRVFLFFACAGILAACSTTSTNEANLDDSVEKECRQIYNSGSMIPETVCFDRVASANMDDEELE